MKSWRKIAVLGVSTVVLAGLAPAATASADEACPERATARTFDWALDLNHYFAMPGGDFEDGGTNWSPTGKAKVVSGSNQTLMPTAGGGSHAMSLPSGSSTTADPLCVEGTATFMRFLARSKGIGGIALVVVKAKDEKGRTTTLLSPALPLLPNWSAPLLLFRLPLLADDFTSVTIDIRSIGLAPIEVDDVYIDPLRQR